MVLSYREIHYSTPNDLLYTHLRMPAVLLVNAFLATAVAIGFAIREGSLERWTDAHLCLRFGLWSAAVFRLLPPIIDEFNLFLFKKFGISAMHFAVFGHNIYLQAVLALLLICPYAFRVLNLPVGVESKSLWEMCMAAVLIFCIVASVARLLTFYLNMW